MLASWLLVLSVIGYPFVGLVASFMRLDAQYSSIPYRAAIILLAVFVIVTNVYATNLGSAMRFRAVGWLIAFWTAYIARLAWDYMVGVPAVMDTALFFFVGIFIPCVALWWSGPVDWQATAPRMVGYGFLICATATAAYAVDAVEINLDNEEGWRLSFEKANPISLGHAAVTTILAAMCIESRSLMARLLALIAAAIALACLLLTAARGPIIALVLCSLIYVWITKRWALVMTIVLLALPFILVEDSLVIARFSGLTADEIIEESAIYRIEVQGGAFAQFLDNPFLGSAYTELKHLTYPHNMILETTMALGMLGLLLLIPLLKNGASRAAQMARAGQYLPALLLLQYFINEMLSGSLATSTAFWTLLVVVLRSKT